MKPKVFVLVHPAWHGAWFWKKVVPLLRESGHLVFTPTLTGLGERSHLARAEIGLEMHVNDVVNVLKYEDLREVVLVGHSSSGVVITGAADRAPQQIAHVIYLDAFVPEDGQAVLDLITPDRRQSFEGLVKTEGKGWLVPRFAPPPWETIVRDMWGVTHDDDVRWMLDRLGPTPFGHFKDPVQRTNPAAEKLPRAYIRCLQFPKPPLRPARRYGTALRALALRGIGGPPSRGHHHARQSRGSTAGTCVVITYTAAVRYAGALIPGTRDTQRGTGVARAHFFKSRSQ
jgi:pimeloyl-ACP methyl ester carboxylesterase